MPRLPRGYKFEKRSVAGTSSATSYFGVGLGIPIKWRGISRRPIPENWHFIGQRSSPYHLAGNRNAAHPVNAILELHLRGA